MEEPIVLEDLIDKDSNIVKSIVYVYTLETFIPYSMNQGIRDRDKNIHKNLGPYANILKIITDN